MASRLLPSPCSGAVPGAAGAVAAPSQAAPEDSGSRWMVPHEGTNRIGTAFGFPVFIDFFLVMHITVGGRAFSGQHRLKMHALYFTTRNQALRE